MFPSIKFDNRLNEGLEGDGYSDGFIEASIILNPQKYQNINYGGNGVRNFKLLNDFAGSITRKKMQEDFHSLIEELKIIEQNCDKPIKVLMFGHSLNFALFQFVINKKNSEFKPFIENNKEFKIRNGDFKQISF